MAGRAACPFLNKKSCGRKEARRLRLGPPQKSLRTRGARGVSRKKVKIQRVIDGLSRLDLVASVCCFGYGVYSGDVWWMVGGAVSGAVAVWSPARRVQKVVERYVTAKRVKRDDSAELDAKEALYGEDAVVVAAESASGHSWVQGVGGYGSYQLNGSRHNMLRRSGALGAQDLTLTSKWG